MEFLLFGSGRGGVRQVWLWRRDEWTSLIGQDRAAGGGYVVLAAAVITTTKLQKEMKVGVCNLCRKSGPESYLVNIV
jgi:hypothetical protein